MANRHRDHVSIKVDRGYFDNCFEPNRKMLENKLGVKLTQSKFTAILNRSGAKIKYPRNSKIFAPNTRGLFKL
jgi:hypothetical protein